MTPIKIIANWKMNGSHEDIISWIDYFQNNVEIKNQINCILCPPLCYLDTVKKIVLNNKLDLHLGSQDVYADLDHPSTGGVSGRMIKDLGCNYVLIGHSERRIHFQENEGILLGKINSAIKNKLNIIFCVGETFEQREGGITKKIIKKQLRILRGLPVGLISVAYEPVWSIGTGKIPSLESIEDVHQVIKSGLKDYFTNKKDIPVYYGGSVNLDNAEMIMKLDSVDGLLIGAASLDSSSFSGIVNKITAKK